MFELPSVLRPQELLDKAFRRAARVTAKGRDRASRTRNLAIARVRTAGEIIASDLRGYVRGFPSVDRLHPFYRELVDVLVDRDQLKKHLGAVDWGAKTVAQVTRDHVRRMGRSAFRDLPALRREAFGRLASIVGQVGPDLEGLWEARQSIRGCKNYG